MQRKALYAGSWYPTKKNEIRTYITAGAQQQKAIAAVCPHAGWIYSGKVAGEVLSQVIPAELYIMIGPNHRGIGSPVAVYPSGSWETPLGSLPVEESVAEAIVVNSAGFARPDVIAHAEEHSLEVQAPFIKYLSPQAKIVPISLADYRPEVCRNLGAAVAKAVRSGAYAQSTLLLASTDMSHYIPAEQAKEVDSLAIDKIEHLDPAGLLKTVFENDISMCGSGPTAVALYAARELGATAARLVRYATSGDVTGDQDEVVAYAGLIVT